MQNHNNFEIIGTTRDDAIGEVFDKIAKILGLPYPGGPSIAKAALKGDPKSYKLPIPKVDAYDFSFSGLKTAVLRAVQKDLGVPISTPSSTLAARLTPTQVDNFAATFQHTAIETLLQKTQKAIKEYHPKSLLLAGGVSANQELRKTLAERISQGSFTETLPSVTTEATRTWRPPVTTGRSQLRSPKNYPDLFFPPPNLCTDNAAMVASAAHFSITAGQKPTTPYTLDISLRSQIT